MIAKRNDGGLIGDRQIGYTSCHVTLDSRVSMTIFRPDITTGMPRGN
jgi:hypothetical protein